MIVIHTVSSSIITSSLVNHTISLSIRRGKGPVALGRLRTLLMVVAASTDEQLSVSEVRTIAEGGWQGLAEMG